MRRVLVESPLAGNVERNIAYARAALRDCLLRGEAPFASRLLYPQAGVLDDLVPHERALGIEAGLCWGERADATIVYTDLGISLGMQEGIDRARAESRPLEYRSLPEWARARGESDAVHQMAGAFARLAIAAELVKLAPDAGRAAALETLELERIDTTRQFNAALDSLKKAGEPA